MVSQIVGVLDAKSPNYFNNPFSRDQQERPPNICFGKPLWTLRVTVTTRQFRMLGCQSWGELFYGIFVHEGVFVAATRSSRTQYKSCDHFMVLVLGVGVTKILFFLKTFLNLTLNLDLGAVEDGSQLQL